MNNKISNVVSWLPDTALIAFLVLAPFVVFANKEYFFFFHWVLFFLVFSVIILSPIFFIRVIKVPEKIFRAIVWFFNGVFFLSLILMVYSISLFSQNVLTDSVLGSYPFLLFAALMLFIATITGLLSAIFHRRRHRNQPGSFTSRLLNILYYIPVLIVAFILIYLLIQGK